VLGANDGIVSTASLLVGIAAAGADRPAILLGGLAAMTAGAMSMAAGEYVSVSSQSDAEAADRAREAGELAANPAAERAELIGIYRARGLDPDLAATVADQLTARDALGTHLRDELGMTEQTAARPLQAALASATAFACGAVLPLAAAAVLPEGVLIAGVSGLALALLAVLGALGAWAGRARAGRAALRVCFWGAAAMGLTAAVGALFGIAAA
jgi:VIT1/CCC1 family predicted Fe2+/Mn2+ transporter